MELSIESQQNWRLSSVFINQIQQVSNGAMSFNGMAERGMSIDLVTIAATDSFTHDKPTVL